jgi:O-antigen/teichoic acid export membrane protein
LSIKKSISFTFSAQLLNTLIGFLTSIIITRILGTTGRGENALFTNSIAFAVLFFGFSINSTITYFINSGKAKPGELLTSIIFFVIGSTGIVYLVLHVLEHYGKLGVALPGGVQSLQYRLIFTAIYCSNLMSSVITAYLLAFKKFKEVSIYGVAVQLLPALLYVCLYTGLVPYDHADPFRAVVIITFIVALLALFSILFLFAKILPVRLVKRIIPIGLIKQFVFFSLMAYLGNVATFFNYKLDFWVVDAYWGKSALGIYSLAAQLSQLLWILPMAISTVLYSFASNCSQQQAVQYAIQLKQIAFYGTLVLAAIGLVLAYFFIPVLYGQAFSGAFVLMKIFMIGIIPFSIPTVLASLFAARGNFKISFVISLIVLGISAALYFSLIPRFGIRGGAIASAVSYLSAAILCEVWFCRQYNVSIFNLIRLDKKVFSLSGITKVFK